MTNHDFSGFWEKVEPFVFNSEVSTRAEAEVDCLERLISSPEENAAILDVCCGIGRHSVLLAKRGFSVTGVEREARFIRRARQSARIENLRIRFDQCDFRDFVTDCRFEAVLCLWNSFGFCTSETDDERFLRKAVTLIKPGGVFIVDIPGQEVVRRRFRHVSTIVCGQNRLSKTRTLSRDRKWLIAEWAISLGGGPAQKYRITQRLYSEGEVCENLSRIGFSSLSVYGDWDARPYDQSAYRMLVVASL